MTAESYSKDAKYSTSRIPVVPHSCALQSVINILLYSTNKQF